MSGGIFHPYQKFGQITPIIGKWLSKSTNSIISQGMATVPALSDFSQRRCCGMKQWQTRLPNFSKPTPNNQRSWRVDAPHPQSGQGNSTSFERFFTAQVLWDETMADKIAQFLKANPNYQVVVLAGTGHIIYGYGIPSRVARRLGSGKIGRAVQQ